MPPTHPFRRAAALVGAALVLAAGITCTEGPTGPRKSGVYALVGMSPVFSQAATQIYRRLALFELEIDNVRIRLERENGEVAVDTVVAIAAGQDSIVVKLSVEILEGTQEQFKAILEFRDGTQVLFSGTQTITASLGLAPPAAPPITVEYTGPGATVTTLEVQPDTIISGVDDITMRAIGRDANNQVVADLNLEWSVNATLGAMTVAGVFQPIGIAGNAVITAALPTGVEGSATVIVAPAAAVVLISGGGQTGSVGTALELPIVVEVQSTLGGPVAGHTVAFAVTGGSGSISPPTATTGANGRASAILTLGTVPGANGVQVTATGLTPLSISATAVPGAAAQLAMVQQPSATALSGAVLGAQPSVQVQDAFGNAVALSDLAVTAQLTAADGRLLHGTTTVNTNASGIAQFTNLQVTGPVGSTTLTFTQGSLTPAVSNTIALGAGAAVSLTAATALALTDSAGASVAAAQLPSVIVKDASGNPVSGVEVKFRRHSGVGGTINALPDTMVLAASDANGGAALTARRLQTLVGFDTVLVTATGLNDTLRFAAVVNHASATLLAYTQQPPNGTAGIVLVSPVVIEVRDQFGNRVTTGASATANVSVGLIDGTLSGTTSAAAIGGVATFNALTVVTPGSAHRLVASAAGLTSATSNAFNVAAGTGAARTWTGGSGDFAWETAGNWSGGGVPGALDTAVINVGETSVTISTPVSVGKVVVGGGTSVQGLLVLGPAGSLTVSDSLRVAPNGALILQGDVAGTVLSGGRVLIQGTAQWVFGAIAGANPIVVAEGGSFLMSTTAGLNLGRPLENHGVVMVLNSAQGNLTLSNGVSIENSGEFLTQGPVGIVQGEGAAGSFLNFGLFRRVVGDAGTTTIGVPYSNSGTTEVQQGIIEFTGATLTNTATGVMSGTGLLEVDGTAFTNAGTLSPGLSPGGLDVLGALPMQGTSRIAIELGGTAQSSEHDFLSVAGAVSLSGTLEISLINGFQPQVGQTFTIMGFASRTGSFTNITGLNLGGGLELVPQFSSINLTLVVQSVAGATISWTNPAGGAWNDPSNWNLNRVPNSSDIVGIELAGTYTVTLETDVSYTLAGLLLGGSSGTQTLSGDLNTLIINGNTTISPNGALNLIGSTIAGTGTVTNQSTVVLENTTVNSTTAWNNLGTVYVHGTVTFNGIVVTGVNSAFLVQGQAGSGNALLTIASGFTNNGLIDLLSFQESGAQLAVTNGTLINMSMISSSFGQDGGARTLAAHLDNRGLLFVETPLTVNRPTSALFNSGSIDLRETLTVNGDFAQTATGFVSTRIGGTALFSRLEVSGTAALAGGLQVALFNGFVPVAANVFTPVAYGSHTGTFAVVDLPSLEAGLSWVTDVGAADVRLTVAVTSGATVSWINAAGGNWSVGSNWSTGVPPTSADVVGIDLAGTYTVTLDANITIAGLELGAASGTQNVAGSLRNVAINGPINVHQNGTLNLTSSTLNGTGSVTNNGTIVLAHSTVTNTITNHALITAHGTVNINNTLTTSSTSTLRSLGQSSTSTATLIVQNSFTNNGLIELTSTSGHAATLTVTTGTLTNAPGGQIRSLTTGTRTLAAALNNQGTLEVDNELTMNRAASVHTNSGTIDLSANDLVLTQSSGSFTNTGTVTLGSGRTWTVNGGLLDVVAGTVSGTGLARLIMNNATLDFAMTNWTLPLTLTNTAIEDGSVTIGNTQTLTLRGGGLSDPVTIQNGGTLLITGTASLTGPANSVTVEAGGVLQVLGQQTTSTGALTVANGFTNSGTIELTSTSGHASTLAVTTGTLTNAVGGAIRSLTTGTRTLAAALNNQGTLVVDNDLTMNKANAAHLNSGTIGLAGANLTITQSGAGQSFTNSGTIDLQGNTLINTGGPFVNNLADAMAIIGPGTLNVGTTFFNNGEVRPNGVLNVTGNYTQGVSGVLNSVISGSLCSQFDQLVISGSASLAGTLNVFVNDCLPLNLTTRTMLTSSGLTGTFTYLPAIYSGGSFLISYPSNSVVLTATAN